MLLMTVLPICLFAKNPVHLHVCKGGTDTRQAPTINYLQHVLLPTLKRMGINAELTVQRYGYYPKGMGEVTLKVQPTNHPQPIRLENFGNLQTITASPSALFWLTAKSPNAKHKQQQKPSPAWATLQTFSR
jgi:RNA 3'-terminal phosphate cyclase